VKSIPSRNPNPRLTASLSALLIAILTIAAGKLPAQDSTSSPRDYTDADVHFMQGMIIHHAQAVVMSDWAPSHGARPDLEVLC
jgi:uncharacterized protein (DUF305 family)